MKNADFGEYLNHGEISHPLEVVSEVHFVIARSVATKQSRRNISLIFIPLIYSYHARAKTREVIA